MVIETKFNASAMPIYRNNVILETKYGNTFDSFKKE